MSSHNYSLQMQLSLQTISSAQELLIKRGGNGIGGINVNKVFAKSFVLSNIFICILNIYQLNMNFIEIFSNYDRLSHTC